MSRRDFPFTPTTSRQLEVGDFWAVPLSTGRYGCLQVTEVARTGPGSRSTFVAGVVDWSGETPPTALTVSGRRILRRGLVRIEAFTEGHARIVGRAEVTRDREFPSHYQGPFDIGTMHEVWGWQALTAVVETTLPQPGARDDHAGGSPSRPRTHG